jgi:transcription initiation factor TFIID subunit 11
MTSSSAMRSGEVVGYQIVLSGGYVILSLHEPINSANILSNQLVNQTLSQSVPASVILAVKSVTKIYAGELIERARKIQTQWLELSGEDQTTGLVSPPPSATEGEAEGEDSQKTVVRRVPEERRRGPLTPDHLREALRRYKLERQGAVGLLGLGRHQPMTGAERFGIKSMGKRFFK